MSNRPLDYTGVAFGREVWAGNINRSHEYLSTSNSSSLQLGIIFILGALRNSYKVITFKIYKISQVNKIFVDSKFNNHMDIMCFINIL